MKDDESLFQGEMKDVVPLKQARTVDGVKGMGPTPAQLARRISAVTQKRLDPNNLDVDHVDMLDPHDPLGWKSSGVQDGVYKKLRLARYPIEAILDLHRLTVAQAREEVYRFICDCQEQVLRTVLITHGKGIHSETPAKIKSYVAHWLCQMPQVLAFHSAQPHQGGVGAVYILLSKKAKNKQKSGQQFMTRL